MCLAFLVLMAFPDFLGRPGPEVLQVWMVVTAHRVIQGPQVCLACLDWRDSLVCLDLRELRETLLLERHWSKDRKESLGRRDFLDCLDPLARMDRWALRESLACLALMEYPDCRA